MSLRFTSPSDFQRRLLADPTLFAHEIDLIKELVLFVHLSREDYQRASFLDGRIITPNTQGAWMRFHELDAALAGAERARPVHFIFHSGHVGSTLLSRLLDATGAVLGIREPACLRTLADAADNVDQPDSLVSPQRFEALVDAQVALWSRGYPDTLATVVKTTSTASRLAPVLLDKAPNARALFLSLRAEPYMAALLSGENSIVDLRGHGPSRMRRLRNYGEPGRPLHTLSAGELAAMAWTVETLTHAHVRETYRVRTLALDFDDVLQDVEATLRRICAHLQLPASAPDISQAAQDPILSRYSKDPGAAYSAQTRAARLEHARRTHAEEITRGTKWLEAFAARNARAEAILATA
ncbi:MAG: hypothetical protein R3C25_06170 [Hyphomonadaceae bacterium]